MDNYTDKIGTYAYIISGSEIKKVFITGIQTIILLNRGDATKGGRLLKPVINYKVDNIGWIKEEKIFWTKEEIISNL